MKHNFIICLLLLAFFSGCALHKTKSTPDGKMEPRFQKRQAFFVIGLEAIDAMEGDKMMELWGAYFDNKAKIPNPLSDTAYGITYFGPAYNAKTMKGYSYFVGEEVTNLDFIPAGLLGHIVPAGNYAIFLHRGPVEKIDATYNYIFGKWLQENGKKPALQDVFEVYDQRFIHGSDESVLEIWVPLAE